MEQIKSALIIIGLTVAFLSSESYLFAQSKPAGIIKGKIIDGESKKPLLRATVTIHNATTNADKQVTGGYTDRNGNFSLNVNPGNYYLQVKFVSYETQTKRNIVISSNNLTYDAGTIALKLSTVMTKEVQVTAEREAIEVGLDRKVFNIEQDVQNLGGSAVDVLSNIPSVTVDEDDNVSLRGNSNVRIMIDGRMSNLDAAEALEQIPATMITSVELITNPGARYDAEGTAGIINVVTTKERQDGINAIVNLNAGTDDDLNSKLNGSVGLSWNLGKWNIFANFAGRAGNRSGTGGDDRTTWDDNGIAHYLNETDTSSNGGRFMSGKIGFDYNFTENDVLTYSFRANRMKRVRNSQESFYDLDDSKVLLNRYDRIQTSNPNFGLNTENALTYKHNFAEKGHELFVDIFYTTFNRNKPTSNYQQRNFLAPDFATVASNDYEKSISDVSSNIFLTQFDYAVPIGTNFKLEAGGKFSTNTSDIMSEYSDKNAETDDWIINPQRSDKFNYTENVYAAYVTASSTIAKKFKYQLGVRSETTVMDFQSFKTPTENFNKTYTRLFPSIYLTYEHSMNHLFNVSLSSRMRRPRYRELNPSINYEDLTNLSSGNPELKPESMYAGEAGYMLNLEKTTVTATVFYRYTSDEIERYRRISDDGDTTWARPENMSTSSRTGFEFIAMQKINDWWKVDGNYTLYNTRLDATNMEGGIDRNDYNWQVRLNSVMSFGKALESQLSANYRSRRIRAQGETKPNWNMNLSLKYNISDALSLSLRVQDIFNTRQWESIESANAPTRYYFRHYGNWNSRSYFLGLTYKLRDFKQERERQQDSEGRMTDGDE